MTKSLITLGFGIVLLASSSYGMAYLYCGDYNNSLCTPGSASVSCQWHNGNTATCTCKDQGHAYAYSCGATSSGNKGGGQASASDPITEPATEPATDPIDLDALLAALVTETENLCTTSAVPGESQTTDEAQAR